MSYTYDSEPSGSYTNDTAPVPEARYGVARYGSSLYGNQQTSYDSEPSTQTLIPANTVTIGTNTGVSNTLYSVGVISGNNYDYRMRYFRAQETTLTKLIVASNGVVGTPPGNLKISVDPNDVPLTDYLDTVEVTAAEWQAAAGGELELTFATPIPLTPGADYEVTFWVEETGTGNNYYSLDGVFTGCRPINNTTDIFRSANNFATQTFNSNRSYGFFRRVEETPAYYTENYSYDSKPS